MLALPLRFVISRCIIKRCFLPATTIINNQLRPVNFNNEFLQYRHKSSGRKQNLGRNQQDEDDEIDSDDEKALKEEDWTLDSDSKVITLSVASLRTDLILKASLGTARNKIEAMFYESKIKVNGKKLLKKSSSVCIGDDIDILRGPSTENPQFQIVSRIHILDAVQKNEDRLSVRIRKFPKLLVQD